MVLCDTYARRWSRVTIKTDEYIKYLTERVITYMDTPREVRRELRTKQRSAKPPWHVHWFGMVPMSIRMLFGKKRTPPYD